MAMRLRLSGLLRHPVVRRERPRLVRRLLVLGVLGAGAFWLSRWEGPAPRGGWAEKAPAGTVVGDVAVP